MKNDENVNFIEIAKQKGKIKDLKEAFIEYPVEEEWHKGNIENLLSLAEESEEYKKSFYEQLKEEE